jgi:hypothetical protein
VLRHQYLAQGEVLLRMSDYRSRFVLCELLSGIKNGEAFFYPIDYDEVRLCLRTAATNGPIVRPPGDMSSWRAMVMMMMMPARDNL